jgi:uncharacterized protein YprB with RNaseH-like and TPR domain
VTATSKLTSRLREIMRPPGAVPAPPAFAVPPMSASAVGTTLARSAADALGGRVVESPLGSCVFVEREYAATYRHGLLSLRECAAHAAASQPAFALLAGAAHGEPSAANVVYLDIETTGLAGGAGTYAFLVGCGWFDNDVFRVEQFLMAGHGSERAHLAALRERLERAGPIVTYNGRSFDVPVLDTRYLYHREQPPTASRAHLDMLHVARRLWRNTRPVVAAPGQQTESCTLASLERALFGVRRHGDVPGCEIPSRYFGFLRSGRAHALEAVLEHNRLDLVSLAALTARALRLVSLAPHAAEKSRECLGLGRIFDRVGMSERADECYQRALTLTEGSWHAEDDVVRAESLRALAVRCRRAGRHGEAASHWEAITGLRRCPDGLMREALEALAIHHEHRSRDLLAARGFATRLRAGAAHRLARLERKLERECYNVVLPIPRRSSP